MGRELHQCGGIGEDCGGVLILGISSFKRDTAASLLQDGVVRAAIENKKLVRHNTRGVPDAAIRFCLDDAHIDWRDLDAVTVATRPVAGWRRRSFSHVITSCAMPWVAVNQEADQVGRLERELGDMRALSRQSAKSTRIVNVDHHACHAATAFFESTFDRALILVLDEEGDGFSGTIAIGEGTNQRILKRIAYPHSLALAFSEVTRLIGFQAHAQEHKTQWLSTEGEPVFKDLLLQWMRKPGQFLPCFRAGLFDSRIVGRLGFSAAFCKAIGVSTTAALSSDQARALASSFQQACADIVIDLLQHYLRQENAQRVCLGGGLFHNSLLVAQVEDRFGKGNVHVPPAPGNAGTGIGAALHLWHQQLKKPRLQAAPAPLWGPAFKRAEIKDVLDNCKSRYSIQNTEARKLDAAIDLLQAGKIVAWYQGATEFGPRALGNRSVLASPWAGYVKENLNDYIKHREWFRPFALTVTEEDCAKYFDASSLCCTMNSLARALEACDSTVRSFSLPDGRIRLHIVERSHNPLFWQLLKRFGERAPAPILLNTSFNLFGEPLVVAPREALRSYYCSGIDAMVMENFVLSKHNGLRMFAPQVEINARPRAVGEA